MTAICLLIFQGQKAVILEQDHALRGDLVRESVMCVYVEGATLGGLLGLEHDPQNPADRFIQGRLRQFAGAHRFDDGLDAPILWAGHLPIQPAAERGHAVAHGAPIRNHQPLEAPFILEDLGQEDMMLGSEGAVHLVIGAHHRPGLRLLDGLLEGGQVDFAQGAFVHLGADAEALKFLVVGGVMLERGAHAFRLHALDEVDRQLSGQVRILGEIFKVAAPQRRALHVDARPQHDIHVSGRWLLPPAPRPSSPISATSQVDALHEAVGKQVAGKLCMAME